MRNTGRSIFFGPNGECFFRSKRLNELRDTAPSRWNWWRLMSAGGKDRERYKLYHQADFPVILRPETDEVTRLPVAR